MSSDAVNRWIGLDGDVIFCALNSKELGTMFTLYKSVISLIKSVVVCIALQTTVWKIFFDNIVTTRIGSKLL